MSNYDLVYELFEDREDVEVQEPSFEEPDTVEAVLKGPQGFLLDNHTSQLLEHGMHVSATRKLGSEDQGKDVLFISTTGGDQE